MKEFEIIAKTQFGLEEVLAAEIKELGGKDIKVLNRAVRYQGDNSLLYKSNLSLRTALRVLKPIANFKAFNDHRFYNKTKQIPWTEILSPDQTFAVDAVTHGNTFKHSKFVALRVKDAIVDKFRDELGERPSVDVDNPDLKINVHVSDKFCSISLDSSGKSLDKRGYRTQKTKAPINEVLAAGIIKLSKWDGKSSFIDGMCGSGTFVIEAAHIAANIAPGKSRSFGFERWKGFDKDLWNQVKTETQKAERPVNITILGSDIDKNAIKIATENAKRAGVSGLINFKEQDFLTSEAKKEKGALLLNPPYGERLNQKEINDFYNKIGTRLKHHYAGTAAWIISSNLGALKFVGLKPAKKIKLFNGSLECRLCQYELYDGSKKHKS